MKKETKMGLAGAAAALGAAGAYFFYGSENASKNRAKAAEWMKKAEREIMTELKALKEEAFNQENYERIVSSVSQRYQDIKAASESDVAEFVRNLNGAWQFIVQKRDELRSRAATAGRSTTRRAKTTVRKAGTKARTTKARVSRSKNGARKIEVKSE